MKRHLIIVFIAVLIIIGFVLAWGEHLRKRDEASVLRSRMLVPSLNDFVIPKDTFKQQEDLFSKLNCDSSDCTNFEKLFTLAKEAQNTDKLIKEVRKHISKSEKCPCFLLLKAEILHYKQKSKQAIKEINKALYLDENNLDVLQKSADFSYYNRDFDRALVIGQKCLKLANNKNDDIRLARALGNLAATTFMKDSEKRALELQNQAIEIHKRLKMNKNLLKDYFNRASMRMRQASIDLALQDFEQARKISEKLNDNITLYSILQRESLCYKKINQIAKAKEMLAECQRILHQVKQEYKKYQTGSYKSSKKK